MKPGQLDNETLLGVPWIVRAIDEDHNRVPSGSAAAKRLTYANSIFKYWQGEHRERGRLSVIQQRSLQYAKPGYMVKAAKEKCKINYLDSQHGRLANFIDDLEWINFTAWESNSCT